MMVCPSVALDSSGLFGLFGLSLSTPVRHQPVRVELVETWAWSLIWRCAWLEGGSRESPGGDSLFFASPKKSEQKKGDPQSATPALRYGANLRRGGCGVRRGTRFALARAARTATASQFTKHGRFDAHATPQPPRRRRSQQGVGQPNSQTATRAIALLGPAFAGASASRCDSAAERSAAKQWPVWMFGAWVPFRMRRGAQRAGWPVCRRTHRLRALTRCGCLSGARSAKRVPQRTPPASTAGCPERSAGTQPVGSPFLWFLSFGDPKERDSHAGRLPASALKEGMPDRLAKSLRAKASRSQQSHPPACALRKSRTIKTIATSACWISSRGQKCSKSRTSTSTTAAPTSCAT
jgi:hypothetical protein